MPCAERESTGWSLVFLQLNFYHNLNHEVLINFFDWRPFRNCIGKMGCRI